MIAAAIAPLVALFVAFSNPMLGWSKRTRAIIVLSIMVVLLCFVIEAMYRHYRSRNGKLKRKHQIRIQAQSEASLAEMALLKSELGELKKHKLVFEIDKRKRSNTNITVTQTSCTRIMLTIDLRFENLVDEPIYMKEIRATLRRGPEDLFMWFAVLQITSNTIPITKEAFEPMRIDGHQLTPFYSVLFMLATPDDQEIVDLDANYYLQVRMETGGHHQSPVIANLHPYWDAALKEGGTGQIAITGNAKTIERDYTRID